VCCARLRRPRCNLNYAAAATELNVTLAAVGQLVLAFEETLGGKLFHLHCL
jgi:DNA-binding transcriptional LysR family regulator